LAARGAALDQRKRGSSFYYHDLGTGPTVLAQWADVVFLVLVPDVQRRATAHDCLKHPWLLPRTAAGGAEAEGGEGGEAVSELPAPTVAAEGKGACNGQRCSGLEPDGAERHEGEESGAKGGFDASSMALAASECSALSSPREGDATSLPSQSSLAESLIA
jgi:hypothetical protein